MANRDDQVDAGSDAFNELNEARTPKKPAGRISTY